MKNIGYMRLLAPQNRFELEECIAYQIDMANRLERLIARIKSEQEND